MQLLTDKTFENEDVAKITELIVKWCSEYNKNKNFWYNKIKSKNSTIENFVNSLMDSQEFIEIKSMYI